MAVSKGGEKAASWVLRLLFQPYKWLVFAPPFVLSTCFFVGLVR